ncbi:hypothetical protein Bbelb_230430 [Branchiostoma belcheri]|nr:hypothetical protein Bbelb_230430 [Branchiostoma belcheri]
MAAIVSQRHPTRRSPRRATKELVERSTVATYGARAINDQNITYVESGYVQTTTLHNRPRDRSHVSNPRTPSLFTGRKPTGAPGTPPNHSINFTRSQRYTALTLDTRYTSEARALIVTRNPLHSALRSGIKSSGTPDIVY